MRVILDQTEIFTAISHFVRSKWKLEEAATVEISITAGRNPKGYSADVEITYPEEAPSNITTRVVDADVDDTDTDAATPGAQTAPPVPEAVTSPAAAAADSAVKLFD